MKQKIAQAILLMVFGSAVGFSLVGVAAMIAYAPWLAFMLVIVAVIAWAVTNA